jgi:hypothetical protein
MMQIHRGHDLIRRLMLATREQRVGDFNALVCGRDAV